MRVTAEVGQLDDLALLGRKAGRCVAGVYLGERSMVAGRGPRGGTRLAALVSTPRYDVPASCGVRRPVRSPMGDFLGGLIAHSSFSISRQAHRGSMRTRSRAA